MIVLNSVQLLPVLTTVAGHRVTSSTIGHHSITLRQVPDHCINRPAAVRESTVVVQGQIRILMTVNVVIVATFKIAPRKAVDIMYLTRFY